MNQFLHKVCVILLLVLFLFSGNIAGSFSIHPCVMEECFNQDCCEDVKVSPDANILHSENNCCEFDQNYGSDSAPMSFGNNSNNNFTFSPKQFCANHLNWSVELSLPEKYAAHFPYHHSITILRI